MGDVLGNHRLAETLRGDEDGLLGVNVKTLYSEIAAGRFPALRLGRAIRISRSAIVTMLEGRVGPPGGPNGGKARWARRAGVGAPGMTFPADEGHRAAKALGDGVLRRVQGEAADVLLAAEVAQISV